MFRIIRILFALLFSTVVITQPALSQQRCSNGALICTENSQLFTFNSDIKLSIELIIDNSIQRTLFGGEQCTVSEVGLGWSKDSDARAGNPIMEFRVSSVFHSASYDGTIHRNFSYETTGNYPSGRYYPHLYLYCADGSIGATETWPVRDLDNRLESSLLESAAGSNDIFTLLIMVSLLAFWRIKVNNNA